MRFHFTIRDLLARRLQFRLMLLLLITALFGAIFGWRSAIDQKKRLDLESKQASREQELVGREKFVNYSEEYDYTISDQTEEAKQRRRKDRERELEEIEKERERLRALKP